MASGGRSRRPDYFVAFSVMIRKGKYKKLGTIGMWKGDGNGPMMRGSVKDDYLGDLSKQIRTAHDNDQVVTLALFKNKPFKRRDEDDDDDDDDRDEEDEEEDEEEEEEEEEDEEEEEEEEEEEDEKPKKKSKKKTKKSKKDDKKKKGKKGKKDSWDFD